MIVRYKEKQINIKTKVNSRPFPQALTHRAPLRTPLDLSGPSQNRPTPLRKLLELNY